MTDKKLAHDFLTFLSAATTPYHAVALMIKQLTQNGFSELNEKEAWFLTEKGKHFVVRGGTSLVAFHLGQDRPEDSGFYLVGSHTDSPTLKLKNQPEKRNNGYLSLTVEPYGGAILPTWFDRDLSLAGNVSYLDPSGLLKSTLVDFQRPIGIIPNLAIHLNPKVNEINGINKQTDLPVVVQLESNNKSPLIRDLLTKELTHRSPEVSIKEILDFDLQFYDSHPPGFLGFENEFIAGQRLDNLLSCFAGLQALINHKGSQSCLLVCNDHEEVGSNSHTGAAGTFLMSVLERICKSRERFNRTMARSLLVSVDNAHGIHPSFQAKHDDNHKPLLNCGPVIKINANQRYATNNSTSSFFRWVCRNGGVPVQTYIHRSDMSCGTTIGPITSTNLGVNTLDIGVATFAMHSIRETCGADDIGYLYTSLKNLYETALPE